MALFSGRTCRKAEGRRENGDFAQARRPPAVGANIEQPKIQGLVAIHPVDMTEAACMSSRSLAQRLKSDRVT